MQDLTTLSRDTAMPAAVIDAISALQRGEGVIVADDADRENECDFIFAAQTLTPEQMALMIRHGSGIVCAVITQAHADHMGLPPMVHQNASPYKTPFTISVEASNGVTTGVSAQDRTKTIHALTQLDAVQSDLRSPGHVFPLVAHPDGLRARRGHTEATLALMELAGLPASGVLCEAMTDDGRMACYADIATLGAARGMPLITIDEIAQALAAS
ncbi:3,4-dihydroxy-2-butanone-4-phosphate synthase [Loktanella sp. S4079]|uniref:3,4-dihydroxy-2-butanone-4-phosphate synthase n=1 Tax=Loktanella sp. S4079 TaxID=579483 RepID=UPI000A055388|nr:3,4-dihydroxy-2-butanone-4-phosphate synthase [Loktanella sp. S4079]